MEITDFLTLEVIATYMGSIISVFLLTEVLKDLPIIKKIPTKYFVIIVSFIHLLIISLVNGTFSISSLYLLILNSIVIALAAMGGKDFSSGKITIKESNKDM